MANFCTVVYTYLYNIHECLIKFNNTTVIGYSPQLFPISLKSENLILTSFEYSMTFIN